MEEEIVALLREMQTVGLTYATVNTVLLLLIGGGLLSYLRKYLEAKATQLAIKENLENLVKQVEATTKATTSIQEAIKLPFSKDLEQYKSELQVDLEFKKGVMPSRLRALKELWSLMEVVSPVVNEELTAKQRLDLEKKLRTWYYEKGNGIFLSLPTADAFLKAKHLLSLKPQVESRKIRDEFSALRTKMKLDVGVYGPSDEQEQIGPKKDG